MNIGINVIPLRPGEVGGIEIYIRDLLRHLLILDKENQYILFTADYNHDTFEEKDNLKKILIHKENKIPCKQWLRFIPNILISKLRSTRNLNKSKALIDVIVENKIELLFCPFGNLDPRPVHIPSVITIPDLQHEYFPEHFSQMELEHRNTFYPESCQMSTRVIAISDFTKKTIVERYGISLEKIKTIWLAQGDQFQDQLRVVQSSTVQQKYNLPLNFAFYPANTWPHKNHKNLILAFAHYKQITGKEKPLVLTGASIEGRKNIEALVAELNLDKTVFILGYIPREDLLGLYLLADYLIFPSVFEGFGIPIVEAMACGCPVLASNTTSLPEIIGEAGILFDPKSPKSILDAMMLIENSPDKRQYIIKKGYQRANMFSLRKTAQETIEVFFDAYNNRKSEDYAVASGIAGDAWLIEPAVFTLVIISDCTHLRFTGELPGIDLIIPQVLDVFINNEHFEVIEVNDPGEFSFSIKINNLVRNSYYTIKIKPHKWFVPSKVGMADNRELAVKIYEMYLESKTASKCIWKYGGR